MPADSNDTKMARPLIVIIEKDRALGQALAMLVHDWGYAAIASASAASIARKLGGRIVEIRAVIADHQPNDSFTGAQGAQALMKAMGRRVPAVVTSGHPHSTPNEPRFPVIWKPFDQRVLQVWLDLHVDRADKGTFSTCIH
jgi:DNA-binding NtrC family response regulator